MKKIDWIKSVRGWAVVGLAIAALMLAVTPGAQARVSRHHSQYRHRAHRPYLHFRQAHGRITVRQTPRLLRRPLRVPATPIPKTPGAIPATPPVVPGHSGDTRTPMTPPGVGGTGVPGGPGTLP